MLNHQQAAAASADTGFTLILAGAGTGKTTTLVGKVSQVIAAGITRPEQVMLLTFSRAAAEEMKGRISSKVPDAASLTAGTFHSVALSILRSFHAEWAGIRRFHGTPTVIDEKKQSDVVSSLATKRLCDFLGLPLSTIVWLMTPHNRKRGEALAGFELVRGALDELLGEYRDYKSAHSLADFGDLIGDCCRLLRERTHVRRSLHESFRYIFIDEFQDIADETLEFVRLLLPESGGNLCAVGDDAQAIYSFMGSTPRHICSFAEYFPCARLHRLTENYRSRREIIELSNGVIARNNSGIRKKLRAVRGKGGSVTFHSASGPDAELETILKICDEAEKGSISILFRNNWQVLRARSFFEERRAGCADGIVFQTIHASKGLEYDTVILAGVEDGIFPGICSDIEEERRLLYVALTRARNRLHIVYRSDGEEPSSFAKECMKAKEWAGKRALRLYLDKTVEKTDSLRKRIGL